MSTTNNKYDRVSQETLEALAKSEVELNKAQAKQAEADAALKAEQAAASRRRKLTTYADIAWSCASAAMLGSLAYYYIKQGRSIVVPESESTNV